jgi:hypothetical protein
MALLLTTTLAIRNVLNTIAADYFRSPRVPAGETADILRCGDIRIGRGMVPAYNDTYNARANQRLADIFKYIFPELGAISASYTQYTENLTRIHVVKQDNPKHRSPQRRSVNPL